MNDQFAKLLSWLNDNVIGIVRKSHGLFWDGNAFFFIIFVVSLIILFCTCKENPRGKKLLFSFTIIAMAAFCYNPLIHKVFLKMPESGNEVYSRVWIILPVWVVIAFATSEFTEKIKSVWARYGLLVCMAAGIVLTGSTLTKQGFYLDTSSSLKVRSEGIEIADAILSESGGGPAGILLYINDQQASDNFYRGGTVYSAIEQYTGKLRIFPIYYSDEDWNDYYSSDYQPDGVTRTDDYLNELFAYYRRWNEFSFVVMPQDKSVRTKMAVVGYRFIDCVGGNDIYEAMPRWRVQSMTGVAEDGKKIYVLSDNLSHYIVVDGGGSSDIEQLKRVTSLCGNHVDMWIMTNLSSDNLEGFNQLATLENIKIDIVNLPSIDISSIPWGFMDDDDIAAYEETLRLADDGVFELDYLSKGDVFEAYGMSFTVLSDMCSIQSGNVMDNSMLFRMSVAGKSFLFCSNIGFEQGQAALEEYGDALDSDFVQISSGSGDGLGIDFYNAVGPQIAFCDSISEGSGLTTYELLNSSGITCYCVELNDPNSVIIE